MTTVTQAQSRLGIIVPKYGRTAVERNRLKRRIREIGRIELLPFLPLADLVLRAIPAAYRATFVELRADVHQVLAHVQKEAPAP